MQLSRRQVLKFGVLSSAAIAVPLGRHASGLDAPAAQQKLFSGSIALPGGFTVPAGQVWAFDPNVSTTVVVKANVIVSGVLVMRPARPDVVHTLRFEGVNEAGFVGGDVPAPVASDVGLWVIGAGALDAQGTLKAGWNRTGNDLSWVAGDELIVAPNAKGDLNGFKPFTKGSVVPTVTGPDGKVFATEVANLTRNVRIEGTPTGRAHISIRSTSRQNVRYVAIRYMGPQKATGATYRSGRSRQPIYSSVLGRYGLHFHHCKEGSRGTVVEGVVVRNCGGRAYVPHDSHGVTFRDCVAYDVRDAAFWWDEDEESHDILFERCAALYVPNNPGDTGLGIVGFMHGLGLRNVTTGCVAAGVFSYKVNSGGFMWPASANHGSNVWTWEDNVAHNNRDAGVGVWQNDLNPHVITRYVGYHNGTGISHGAYTNTYTYRDVVTFRNNVEVVQHALGGITFDRSVFAGNVLITKHALASTAVTRYVNCRITGMVQVAESGQPGVIRFESMLPANDLSRTRFSATNVLSNITVANSTGPAFKL